MLRRSVCVFPGQVFSNATVLDFGGLFVCLFALVKADFTTGLIAYIWIYAMLNTVCFGDLSEASA